MNEIQRGRFESDWMSSQHIVLDWIQAFREILYPRPGITVDSRGHARDA